jgi:hypothetical protein
MKILITSLAALAMACAILTAADDLQTNSDSLRAAVDGKKPAAEIKRLAVLVMTEAKKQMGPAPADADKDNWEAHVKYAEQVSEYAEYALYSTALSAPPATQIDLISTLEAQAPKSKYLNQDAYLAVANAVLSSQPDRASAFAKKAITAPKGAKPDQATASAHWIVGVVAANKKDWVTTDKELRASLAGIKGTAALEGPAYYFLGEAVYALGRQSMDRGQADQGIKFMLQSALISGQYQSGAAAEARRMKGEMGEK